MCTSLTIPQAHRYPLHHDRTSPAAARRITRTALTGWGWHPQHIDAAVVVVSELVTNAVEHALPPISLHLEPDPNVPGPPSLRVKVTDGGPDPQGAPHLEDRAPDEHGRGIPLIDGLSCDRAADSGPDNHWVRVCAVTGRARAG